LQKRPIILRSLLIAATTAYLPACLRISTRYQVYIKKEHQRITSVQIKQSKNIKYINKRYPVYQKRRSNIYSKKNMKKDQRYETRTWINSKKFLPGEKEGIPSYLIFFLLEIVSPIENAPGFTKPTMSPG